MPLTTKSKFRINPMSHPKFSICTSKLLDISHSFLLRISNQKRLPLLCEAEKAVTCDTDAPYACQFFWFLHFSSSSLLPCLETAAEDGPSIWGPCHPSGRPDGVPASWLPPAPALAVAIICRVNKLLEVLSTTPCFSLCNSAFKIINKMHLKYTKKEPNVTQIYFH